MRRCPACGLSTKETEFCPTDGRRLFEVSLQPLASLSHQGYRRTQNQDAVTTGLSITGGLPWITMVVCDGVSSSPHSAQAAEFIAQTLQSSLQKLAEVPASAEQQSVQVREAILQAHRGLCHEAHTWNRASPPGTTVVVALLQGDQLTIGWVGDSRAYWFSESEEHQLTQDHSWLYEVVQRGEMTEAEALLSPNAHAITRCLGPLEGIHSEVEPDIYSGRLSSPGILLLCTDGLWNYTPAISQLHRLIKQGGDDANRIAQTLLSYALQSGGGDNISVAVYRHGG